jgi:hypothetical protein
MSVACALTADSQVWCWGGTYGDPNLGPNGPTSAQLTSCDSAPLDARVCGCSCTLNPVQIPGLPSTLAQIVNTATAVTSDGHLWDWSTTTVAASASAPVTDPTSPFVSDDTAFRSSGATDTLCDYTQLLMTTCLAPPCEAGLGLTCGITVGKEVLCVDYNTDAAGELGRGTTDPTPAAESVVVPTGNSVKELNVLPIQPVLAPIRAPIPDGGVDSSTD